VLVHLRIRQANQFVAMACERRYARLDSSLRASAIL